MTLTNKELKEALKSREKIPKFYFQDGKPLDEEKKAEVTKLIDDAYRGKESLTK